MEGEEFVYRAGASCRWNGVCFASVLAMLLSLFLLSGCNADPAGATAGTPLLTQTVQVTSPTQAAGGISVKIYFSKINSPDLTTVFPVNRVSPDNGVATFSLQQLIIGPTSAEKNAGYVSQLHESITGNSTCTNHVDFLLSLNKKGTIDQQGTTTVKFCRVLSSAGIGTDARMQAEITKTLTQFSTIQKVVILTVDGHCLGDESGLDRCLQ
ncbi:GerMN domain-containing protein [Tengunoibacter tsumagoiensis]|uniref:GerMN domain-containing protein n=1 Tax=Tengunoibacter tsumagoiensis TaxID=2014871 RepID=A0A402A5Q3_9CHLR|nr:GerMN domain-containing protein [Tengunoibacter tsumagoiensis]GCE14474.1 hypothetical protein KTT_43330 [Tengunoibacter tsumagoiensis]